MRLANLADSNIAHPKAELRPETDFLFKEHRGHGPFFSDHGSILGE